MQGTSSVTQASRGWLYQHSAASCPLQQGQTQPSQKAVSSPPSKNSLGQRWLSHWPASDPSSPKGWNSGQRGDLAI